MAQLPINREINSAWKGVAITPDTPFSPSAGINCGTAGAGTVTWLDETTSTYYFSLGNNAVQITNIAASGLTAADLVALYNQ